MILFEALKSMKISSHEPVSSQKYENEYRTKICDFTSVRPMYSFQFPLALTVALYTSDVVKHLPLSGHTSFLRQLHCRSSSFSQKGSGCRCSVPVGCTTG